MMPSRDLTATDEDVMRNPYPAEDLQDYIKRLQQYPCSKGFTCNDFGQLIYNGMKYHIASRFNISLSRFRLRDAEHAQRVLVTEFGKAFSKLTETRHDLIGNDDLVLFVPSVSCDSAYVDVTGSTCIMMDLLAPLPGQFHPQRRT